MRVRARGEGGGLPAVEKRERRSRGLAEEDSRIQSKCVDHLSQLSLFSLLLSTFIAILGIFYGFLPRIHVYNHPSPDRPRTGKDLP